MPVRYPLLFSNRHSYRFLRKYPFIPFGCAIFFLYQCPLMQRRLLRFVSRQPPAIFLYLFFPSFLLPDRDSDIHTPHTPVVGSPSVEIHHESSFMGWPDGIPACAVSTLPANGMFSVPDVLPGFMTEQAVLCVVRRTSPSDPKSATSCLASSFFATVFYRSHHHYSVAKLVCRRERPCGLDQWRTA